MARPAPTTRERQSKFLATFGADTVQRAVADRLRRLGPAWLTDEQLAEIAADIAAGALATTRHRNRNRQNLRSAA